MDRMEQNGTIASEAGGPFSLGAQYHKKTRGNGGELSNDAEQHQRGHCLGSDDKGDEVAKEEEEMQQDERDEGNEEEARYFEEVCDAYRQYATFRHFARQGTNCRIERYLSARELSLLPPSLIPKKGSEEDDREWRKRQNIEKEAEIGNQYFLDNVLQYAGAPTSQDVLRHLHDGGGGGSTVDWVTDDSMSKINSVLKSVARDWSAEGRQEREVPYNYILAAFDKYLPIATPPSNSTEDPHNNCLPRIAVPGSGLGRLAWELVSRGYSVQGSDFSLHMLLASDFLLNGIQSRQFAIHPYLAETKNVKSFASRARKVIVPDVDPSSIASNFQEQPTEESGETAFKEQPDFSMLAGEFISLYSHYSHKNLAAASATKQRYPQPPHFHGIASCFFLDTAPLLPQYLVTMYDMLVDGGILVNFGPLMYHWSGHGNLRPDDERTHSHGMMHDTHQTYQHRNRHLDSRYLQSVDFAYEDVRYMLEQCGFEILEQQLDIPSRYTCDRDSMMNTVYNCCFFVAKKVGKS